MSETIKNKLIDFIGTLLGVFIPVMYLDTLSGGRQRLEESAAKAAARVRLWCQYNLAVILRPWFVILAGFVLVVTMGMAYLYWQYASVEVSTVWFLGWLAFNLSLVVALVALRVRLQAVSPINSTDFQRLMDDPDQDAARALLETHFGPSGRMSSMVASLLLITIPFQAISMMVFASAMNGAGMPWAVSAIFVLVALLLAGLGLAIAISIALLLGTTLRVVGSIAFSLFKGGWDSIITMLPNIEGEEAKLLLEKDLGKKLSEVWSLFQKALLSEPGKASVGLAALFIVWHHPLEVVFLTLLFVGLTFSTGFEHMTGNKVEDKVARAGRVVSGFFLFGFLYRMAEMWRFGLGSSEWYWTYGDTKLQIFSFWNRIVPWWNGLIDMSWWQALLVVIAMSIAINYILKLQEGVRMKRLKYTLVTVCCLVIAAVLVGFVANRASVDARVDPVYVPVERASVEPSSSPVAAVHVPDSIDRMMVAPTTVAALPNLGTMPMVPPFVPSVRIPVAPTVPAVHSASSSGAQVSNMCDRISRAVNLADSFRESMRHRYHCDG